MRIAIGAGLIPLIPLVLTLLGKWQWDQPGVYVLAFVLLFGSGLTYELVAKKMENKAYRFAVGLAVGTAFIVSWVNLVRVSESENVANLLCYGVPAIGAMLFLWRIRPAPGVAIGFGGSAFFATLFVASALLFRRASAQARSKADGLGL